MAEAPGASRSRVWPIHREATPGAWRGEAHADDRISGAEFGIQKGFHLAFEILVRAARPLRSPVSRATVTMASRWLFWDFAQAASSRASSSGSN